jgi:hypothetical protein
MSWTQAHPPGTTSVASTKTQFQQNNLYIENTLQTDHYFDDATASNDGHHKFVQLPVQGADPGASIATGGVYFLKNTAAGNPAPFFQTATTTYSVPVGILVGNVVCNNGNTAVFDFAGYPEMVGWVYAYDIAAPRKALGANFFWNGTLCYVNQRNSNDGQWVTDDTGRIVQYVDLASSSLGIKISGAAVTMNISISGILV